LIKHLESKLELLEEKLDHLCSTKIKHECIIFLLEFYWCTWFRFFKEAQRAEVSSGYIRPFNCCSVEYIY